MIGIKKTTHLYQEFLAVDVGVQTSSEDKM